MCYIHPHGTENVQDESLVLFCTWYRLLLIICCMFCCTVYSCSYIIIQCGVLNVHDSASADSVGRG
jgi:hypothetical protein